MADKIGKCNRRSICKSILVPLIFLLAALHSSAPSGAAATGCLASAGSWANAALSQNQAGSFRVTYDATPSTSRVDAVSGLTSAATSAYTDFAAAVRFNSAGTIDVRNGSGFTATNQVAYSAGVAYHFILDVNVATHTYSAYVVVRSVQTTLGSNVAFRSEQANVRSLGNLAVISQAGGLNVCNIVLSASSTGSSTLLLNPSPSSVNFGSVSVSSSKDQNITLTNAGTSNVTISKVSVSGAGFNASGSAAGLTLSPNQSTTVRATFAPAATGNQSGSITVSSNAKNSPATIALAGAGVAPSAHHVTLAWSSSSGAAGYNVYVATTSGGPYSWVSSTSGTGYVDNTVQSGRSYYYVVTALNSGHGESKYSSEVRVAVP